METKVRQASTSFERLPSQPETIRSNREGRGRVVPLSLSSEHLRRAIEASQHSLYLDPRYCNDKGCKAKSASAVLNKWLKQTIGDGYVMHGFRQPMRDRYGAVNRPSAMIDRVSGWLNRSLGEGYGKKHTLDRCRCFLANEIKQHSALAVSILKQGGCVS